MTRRFLPFLLVFCGFAVTDAQAKPRTVPDRVVAVEGAQFTLAKHGPAILGAIHLNEGETVELKPDQAVEVKALPKDRYGRTPVILYLPGDKISWQEHLLQRGKALIYDRAAVPKAWVKSETTPHAIPVSDAGDHIGEFVVVEGTVTRTYRSRDMYYINFGDDWRTDGSLQIPRKYWRSFGKDFSIAQGTRIRARGVLFLENGPMLEITRPEQLETTHAAAQ